MGRAGALAAVFAAGVYAALSGFGVPAQRAMIMSLVLLAPALLHIRVPASSSLALAAVAVVGLDPAAPLGPGFWLSFAAVALILAGLTLASSRRTRNWRDRLWSLVKLQCLLSLGLMPLTWLLFNQQPLVAPVANLLAVPWVSFVCAPLILVGTALIPVAPTPGACLIVLGGDAVALLLALMEVLARDELMWRPPAEPSILLVSMACAGLFLVLLPGPRRLRSLGLVWCLPLLMQSPSRPPMGEFEATILDVGQGLAVVVETATRVLVYDTGPRFGRHGDAAAIRGAQANP